MDDSQLVLRSASSPARSEPHPHRRWLRILVAAALAGCGGDGGGGGPTTPPLPPVNPNTVIMQDNSFNPATRTVSVGTTVRWVNNGSLAHNTISDTGVWTSANVNPGADFQHTFGTAGSFPYRCTLHAGMTGTIVVQ
jgi:hypothetical protein